jgi:hypothetical protein
MRRILTGPSFAAIVALVGLSCSPSTPVSVPAPVAGPEVVFARLQAAIDKKEWKAALQCFEPRAHDGFLVAATMDATLAAMNKKKDQPGFNEILTRHGVTSGTLPKESINLSDREKMKDLLVQPYASVKDKPALFADLMDYVELVGSFSQRSSLLLMPRGRISNVQMKTKGARADLTRPEGTRTEKVHFLKGDDGWKVFIGKFNDWPD